LDPIVKIHNHKIHR